MEPENRQRSESGLSQKDIHAIEEVISKVKSAGLFDQFRKECLADVDTKPAYHNLVQRVEKFVERFLNSQKWNLDLNKNQLRETLRRQLNNSGVMNIGVDRIIEQVVNPKILLGIKPKIDEAICDYFGINLKTLHKEQQKGKQQHQQCILQHQQYHQNPMSQHIATENAFGAPPGMYPAMSTYPWLHASASASFHGTASAGMTNTDVASSVDPSAVSRISYNPHNFGGMMQPYFMGSWMPGMESFNHTIQPIISGQPLTHSQSMSTFGDGGYSALDAGVTPFRNTPPPSLECANLSFDSLSLPIPPPSIPSHMLPDTPLLNSTSSMASSPRAPDIIQQPSPVAPPGIFTGPAGSIKPPPPGSVPPPPGTVPVVPPASYTPVQASLPPTPATASITPFVSHSLPKELTGESILESIDLFTKVHPPIPRSVTEQRYVPDACLTIVRPSHKLSGEADVMEDSEAENNTQTAKHNEKMREFDRFNLQSKGENDNGRQILEMQLEEDPLPLQRNVGDVLVVRFLSANEEPSNTCTEFEGIENNYSEGSFSFDIDTN